MAQNNPIRAEAMRQATDTINTVYDRLMASTPKGRLPEHIFAGYFLPVFANIRPYSDYPNIIVEWISIAGTPNSEVDIIDPAGKVLYTVPALYDDGVLGLGRFAGKGAHHLAEEYAIRKAHPRANGEAYIADQLTSSLGEGSDISPSTQRWLNIFARYNIQDPTIPAPAQTTTISPQDSMDDLYDLG